MRPLTPADDSLHPPPTDEPWWTETCWFCVDIPGPDLSFSFYPLFRPNLGVCSVAVHAWDASASEPWAVRYGRSLWHVPMAGCDLTDLDVAGLRYERLEPLQRYRVCYSDKGHLEVELDYAGLRPPHAPVVTDEIGHFDQPCRVTGEVRFGTDAPIAVDCLGMRDRTWAPRPDDARGAGRAAAYTFGNASADDHFLVMTRPVGNVGHEIGGLFSGYLVRDGEQAPLATAERRVVERIDGRPRRVLLDATDDRGRRLTAEGLCRNGFANQASPAQFAWMSMVEWTTDRGVCFGEDQEVWPPDLLGPALRGLDT
jgi:hypothetical protein